MTSFFRLLLLPLQAPMLLLLLAVSTYLGLHWGLPLERSGNQLTPMGSLLWSAECAQALAVVVFCFLIAFRCRHQFGRLVAIGLGTNFFLYVFVNIGMVTGSIPVGGVPLPLISWGGSAMLTTMLGFGLLMSVQVHRDVEFAAARD